MSKWVIVASGPSVVRTDFARLRRYRSWNVAAVNNSWVLVPWCRLLYASDLAWWKKYGKEAKRFPGEKFTSDPTAARIHRAQLVRRREGQGLCRQPGFVHTGGNSGYQLVNLLYHMGARTIVLLGFDMHRKFGGHWHGEHENMLSAPQAHITEWIKRFKPLAEDLAHEGVDVVNATPGSKLPWFRRSDLFEVLQEC